MTYKQSNVEGFLFLLDGSKATAFHKKGSVIVCRIAQVFDSMKKTGHIKKSMVYDSLGNTSVKGDSVFTVRNLAMM